MKRRRTPSVLVAAALALACGVCRARATAAGLDPEAVRILRACLDRVKGAQACTVVATLQTHQEMGAQKRAGSEVKFIVLERPNRLALLPGGEERGSVLVCDGERLYAVVPGHTRYVDDDAPPTLEELARRIDLKIVAGRFFLLDALASDDPFAFAMADAIGARIVGEEEVRGAICTRIRVTQPRLEWDVWIENGDKPVLRKASPDLAARLAARAKAVGREDAMTISVEAFYDDWDFTPTVDPGWFAFQPPKRGKKAATFVDLDRVAQRNSPLLGKPAPDLSLPLLEGGTMRLSEHAGKDVVVVEFWVASSPPCLDMLWASVKLAREFREKGVVFYAVNQGEAADDVLPVIKALGADFSIALDEEGAATRLYDAATIPRTIVVGADGTVQAVYAGFNPLVELALRKNLETLLSGGRLVGGPKPLPESEGDTGPR